MKSVSTMPPFSDGNWLGLDCNLCLPFQIQRDPFEGHYNLADGHALVSLSSAADELRSMRGPWGPRTAAARISTPVPSAAQSVLSNKRPSPLCEASLS